MDKLKILSTLAAAGLAALAFAEDAYIQSDGTQHIRTGYCANPKTKIVCDFAYADVATLQQRIFGADDDGTTAGLSFSSYINGSGQYAWAFQDGKGNWTSTNVKADTARRTLTIDGPGNKVTLASGTTVNHTATISTTRTKTSVWPLAVFANNKSSGYGTISHLAKAKLYALDIYEDGVPVHVYRPYRSADGATVGLKDLSTGAVLTQGAGNAFACGGDISDSPALDLPGMRTNGDAVEFLVQADVGADGTLEITKNGEAVSGTSVWATSDDTVVVTATAAAGKRFVQWQGPRTSFAAESYLGDASVTLHPVCPTALTARWTTPHTRTWTPTTKDSSGRYLFGTANNWRDETGATGKPLIGDTVVFGTEASTAGAYQISEGNANNPLYVVQYEDVKTVAMNQGWFALLAGARGLQYLRKANSGSNWSGIYCVGDGIVPVNIANNVEYNMQKGCQLGTCSGFARTPIVVKQGPGTVINFNQSGNYDYTVPKTRLQEGRWDMTMTKPMQNIELAFDGPAAKRLTLCYSSYTADLTFNGGGICEINGAANHTIEANNKNGRVVFTGTPKFNPMVFSGRFTKGAGLVWSPSGADYVFVCSNGVSDTAGQISVTKGTVKLVDGASFTALAELAVSDGAVFDVDAASGANFHAEALTLGATAKLKLAAGVSLAVTAASLAGSALAPGTYAAAEGAGVRKAAWIEGAGTVVVATGPGNSATWVGADPDSTRVTQGANWQDGSVPDLAAGDLFATFAAGGAEARLAGAAGFDGLALNNTAGTAFSFAAESGAQATIAGNGITVADAAAATTWTMGWPVALGADQTWTIGANNTFRLAGTLSGSSKLTIDNAGTVELAAPSVQTGALELKGGTVRVTASNAFGPAGRTVNFHHNLTKYVFAGDLTFDAPMYSGDQRESWDAFLTVEPGSHLTFNGNFGYLAEGGLTFGADSVTVFKGGLKFNTDGMKGKIVPRGSGTMVVSNSNISTCRAWEGQAGNPVTLDLCCAYNALNDSAYWAKFPAGRLLTHAANATKGDAWITFDDATWDLCGQDQSVGLVATTAKTRIVSDEPAMLAVNSQSVGDSQNGTYGGDSRVNKAVFSGRVGLRKNGVHPHALGAESPTAGPIEVTGGTLTFNASGKWPNATAVTVAGGTLVAQNAAAIGENADWNVTAGAAPVVALDFNGTMTCASLKVGDRRMPGGLYGAVGSGAEHEVDWIAGTGLLKVKSNGTTLVFR